MSSVDHACDCYAFYEEVTRDSLDGPDELRVRDDPKRHGRDCTSLIRDLEQLSNGELGAAENDEDTESSPGNTEELSSPSPSEASAATASDEDTESTSLGSTWEFSAPASENSKRQSTISAYSTMTSTPAQELASRYRAGLPLEVVLSSSQPKRATVNEFDPPLSEDENPVVCNADLRPECRQSRHEALLATINEAQECMQAQGVGLKDCIRCARDGCHDVLPGFEALTRHLHIHNLSPRNVLESHE
ncbi:hypothetical protein MD484_g3083, partial [Candolleomyces efflorescens]